MSKERESEKAEPEKRRIGSEGKQQVSIRVPESSITPEIMEEFKELYREKFRVRLSDNDAYERAINFLQLFKATYRPIPVESKIPAPQANPDSFGNHPDSTIGGRRQLKLF